MLTQTPPNPKTNTFTPLQSSSLSIIVQSEVRKKATGNGQQATGNPDSGTLGESDPFPSLRSSSASDPLAKALRVLSYFPTSFTFHLNIIPA